MGDVYENCSVVSEVQRYCLSAQAGALAVRSVYNRLNTGSGDGNADCVGRVLDALRSRVNYPLSIPGILEIFWQLSEQIGPQIASYDLIVGDEISGILPAIFFWRLAHNHRRLNGQPDAQLAFMNGNYSQQAPEDTFPVRSRSAERALIVTDIIASGESLSVLSKAIQAYRSGVVVDAVAYYNHDLLNRPVVTTLYLPTDPDVSLVFDRLYGEQMRGLLDRKKEPSTSLHSYRLHQTPDADAKIKTIFQDTQLMADVMYAAQTGEQR